MHQVRCVNAGSVPCGRAAPDGARTARPSRGQAVVAARPGRTSTCGGTRALACARTAAGRRGAARSCSGAGPRANRAVHHCAAVVESASSPAGEFCGAAHREKNSRRHGARDEEQDDEAAHGARREHVVTSGSGLGSSAAASLQVRGSAVGLLACRRGGIVRCQLGKLICAANRFSDDDDGWLHLEAPLLSIGARWLVGHRLR